jgi:hypothetical protein
MEPMLTPPGTKHLKLNCVILLSTFAFNFNLRRYILIDQGLDDQFLAEQLKPEALEAGSLHSSTSHFNLSRFGQSVTTLVSLCFQFVPVSTNRHCDIL